MKIVVLPASFTHVNNGKSKRVFLDVHFESDEFSRYQLEKDKFEFANMVIEKQRVVVDQNDKALHVEYVSSTPILDASSIIKKIACQLQQFSVINLAQYNAILREADRFKYSTTGDGFSEQYNKFMLEITSKSVESELLGMRSYQASGRAPESVCIPNSTSCQLQEAKEDLQKKSNDPSSQGLMGASYYGWVPDSNGTPSLASKI